MRNRIDEIYIFDMSIGNIDTIIAELPESSPYLVLDSSADGIKQIVDFLSGFENAEVASLHVVSHGGDGTVFLGNTVLSNDTMASYEDDLAAIGRYLTDDGDILLYGCDVAKSQDGKEFINRLHAMTSADIAASEDITGRQEFGGDGDLEYAAGAVSQKISQMIVEHVVAPLNRPQHSPATQPAPPTISERFIAGAGDGNFSATAKGAVDFAAIDKGLRINLSAENYNKDGQVTTAAENIAIASGKGYALKDTSVVPVDAENVFATYSFKNISDIAGGKNNDLIIGNDEANTIEGKDGNDILNGRGGTDTLSGGGGDDILIYSGIGRYDGGADSDTLDASQTRIDLFIDLHDSQFTSLEKIIGGRGADTIKGSAGAVETLFGGGGRDIIYARKFGDQAYGEDGDDTLHGHAARDILRGGRDHDRLWGYDGNDLLAGEQGNDIIHGGKGRDNIIGGAGHDRLHGDGGRDYINGGDGNDILNGGDANDELRGSSGSDIFMVSKGHDTITDFIHMSGEKDMVDLSAWDIATLDDANLGFAIVDGRNLFITSTLMESSVTLERFVQAGIDGTLANKIVTYEEMAGILGAEKMFDDMFLLSLPTAIGATFKPVNGVGGQTFYGNLNKGDIISFESATSAIDIVLHENYALLNAAIDLRFDFNNVESVSGTKFDDIIAGNDGYNRLDGLGGHDVFYGGGGRDVFVASEGTDTIKDFMQGQDIIDFSGIKGVGGYADLQFSENNKIEFSSNNTEHMIILENFDGILSHHDFVFNPQADGKFTGETHGTKSNDTFTANADTVTYRGGQGLDAVDFSAFDRSVRVNLSFADYRADGRVSKEFDGSDIAINARNTRIIEDETLVGHQDGAENTIIAFGLLSIEDIIGGKNNDIIIGNSGSNSLHGGDGNDTIAGGGGKDFIYGGEGTDLLIYDEQDRFYGGGGEDTLDASHIRRNLNLDLRVIGNNDIEIILAGNFNDTLIGDAHSQTLVGGAGHDRLHGGGGDDILRGGKGKDSLDGGDGHDTLTGGEGNDIFLVSMGSDTITDFSHGTGDNSDKDSINLAAWNVNDLKEANLQYKFVNTNDLQITHDGHGATLTVVDFRTTGGIEFADGDIAGTDIRNTLIESDIFILGVPDELGVLIKGYTPDDPTTFIGMTASYDVIDFSHHSESINFELAEISKREAYVNNGGNTVTHTVHSVEGVIGGAGDDILTGNGSQNYLDGKGGDDKLTGGGGKDFFIASAGHDTIYDFDSREDTIDFSALNYIKSMNDLEFSVNESQRIMHIKFKYDTDDATITLNDYKNKPTEDNFLFKKYAKAIAPDHAEFIVNEFDAIQESFIGRDKNSDTLSFADRHGDVYVNLGLPDGIPQQLFGNDLMNGIIASEAENFTKNTYPLESIENIIGGYGNDILLGGEQSNRLDGGKDRADNFLYGYKGADVFVAPHTSGGNIYIGDFNIAEGDKIDFRHREIDGRAITFDDLTATVIEYENISYLQIHFDDYSVTPSGGVLDFSFFGRNLREGSSIIFYNIFTGQGQKYENATYAMNDLRPHFIFAGEEPMNHGTAVGDTLTATIKSATFYGYGGNDAIDFSSLGENLHINLDETSAYDLTGRGTDVYGRIAIQRGAAMAFSDSNPQGVHNIRENIVANYGLRDIESIIAGSGNDILIGNAEDNVLVGGAGNDILNGGGGDDILRGGAGDDTIFFYSGNSGNIDGGDDFDTLDLSLLEKAIHFIVADRSSNFEKIIGSNFGDSIIGSGADEVFDGGGGSDTIRGGAGNDIFIYDEKDTYRAGSDIDTLDASHYTTDISIALNIEDREMENIKGGSGHDILIGNSLSNDIKGGAGHDIIGGDAGDDTLAGGVGDDTIFGGKGDDELLGGIGHDILRGGLGDDIIKGGADHDTLGGGGGDDILTGGAGSDIFLFSSGKDVITDFTYGVQGNKDIIDLSQYNIFGIDDDYAAYMLVGDDLEIRVASLDATLTVNNFRQNSGVTFAPGAIGAGDLKNLLRYYEGIKFSLPINNGIIFQNNENNLARVFLGEQHTIDSVSFADFTYDFSLNLNGEFTAINGEKIHYNFRSIEGIIGGKGNDFITGTELNERLNGGYGNDELRGGEGRDVFVASAGTDEIADFGNGGDMIDFSDFATVKDISDLEIVKNFTHLKINFKDENDEVHSLILTNVADITADDIIFYPSPATAPSLTKVFDASPSGTNNIFNGNDNSQDTVSFGKIDDFIHVNLAPHKYAGVFASAVAAPKSFTDEKNPFAVVTPRGFTEYTQIYHLDSIENIIIGKGGGHFIGDDNANRIEVLGGNSQLRGNGGGDIFAVPKQAGANIMIFDFNLSEGDKLDFSKINIGNDFLSGDFVTHVSYAVSDHDSLVLLVQYSPTEGIDFSDYYNTDPASYAHAMSTIDLYNIKIGKGLDYETAEQAYGVLHNQAFITDAAVTPIAVSTTPQTSESDHAIIGYDRAGRVTLKAENTVLQKYRTMGEGQKNIITLDKFYKPSGTINSDIADLGNGAFLIVGSDGDDVIHATADAYVVIRAGAGNNTITTHEGTENVSRIIIDEGTYTIKNFSIGGTDGSFFIDHSDILDFHSGNLPITSYSQLNFSTPDDNDLHIDYDGGKIILEDVAFAISKIKLSTGNDFSSKATNYFLFTEESIINEQALYLNYHVEAVTFNQQQNKYTLPLLSQFLPNPGLFDFSGVENYSQMSFNLGYQGVREPELGSLLKRNFSIIEDDGEVFRGLLTSKSSKKITGIIGGAGKDIFFGEHGKEVFYGNGGNDIFYASTGNDNLFGGEGYDTVIFKQSVTASVGKNTFVSAEFGYDVIGDMEMISLSDSHTHTISVSKDNTVTINAGSLSNGNQLHYDGSWDAQGVTANVGSAEGMYKNFNSIHASAGDDKFTLYTSADIYLGEGADIVYNSGDGSIISLGTDNDQDKIYIDANHTHIHQFNASDSGHDIIDFYESNNIVFTIARTNFSRIGENDLRMIIEDRDPAGDDVYVDIYDVDGIIADIENGENISDAEFDKRAKDYFDVSGDGGKYLRTYNAITPQIVGDKTKTLSVNVEEGGVTNLLDFSEFVGYSHVYLNMTTSVSLIPEHTTEYFVGGDITTLRFESGVVTGAIGTSGGDTLGGNQGDNILYGEAGDDIFYDEWGSNRLYGGSGKDTFRHFGDFTGTINASEVSGIMTKHGSKGSNDTAHVNQLYDIELLQFGIQKDDVTITGNTDFEINMGRKDDTLTLAEGAEAASFASIDGEEGTDTLRLPGVSNATFGKGFMTIKRGSNEFYYNVDNFEIIDFQKSTSAATLDAADNLKYSFHLTAHDDTINFDTFGNNMVFAGLGKDSVNYKNSVSAVVIYTGGLHTVGEASDPMFNDELTGVELIGFSDDADSITVFTTASINAGGGNDTITTYAGVDNINAGAGADTIRLYDSLLAPTAEEIAAGFRDKSGADGRGIDIIDLGSDNDADTIIMQTTSKAQINNFGMQDVIDFSIPDIRLNKLDFSLSGSRDVLISSGDEVMYTLSLSDSLDAAIRAGADSAITDSVSHSAAITRYFNGEGEKHISVNHKINFGSEAWQVFHINDVLVSDLHVFLHDSRQIQWFDFNGSVTSVAEFKEAYDENGFPISVVDGDIVMDFFGGKKLTIERPHDIVDADGNFTFDEFVAALGGEQAFAF